MKYNKAPKCKHCNKKHSSKKEVNAGNWRQIKLPTQITVNPLKALEGMQGSQ
jgi:hypothetical protein